MDAFELLLRASDANLNMDGDVKDFKPKFQMKPSFDYREHMESTMLDPIDSIMMLADQASQKSPIKKRSGAVPDSPDYRSAMGGDGSFGADNSAMGTLLQYGSYFNMGSPLPNGNNRRSRAMSEPWIRQENWSEELQFNRTMGTATSGNAGNPGPLNSNPSSLGEYAQFQYGFNRDLSAPRGLFNAEQEMGHRLGYSSLGLGETSLPQMLDQYSSIYNKNGRIGIYTREERSAIIHRFREKRKRRVWKKKIRYFCRKNLADRRVRVKGRFVKSASNVKATGSGGSTSSDSPTNTNTSTTSGAGTPHKTGRGVRSGSAGTDITESSDLTSEDVRRNALSNANNAYRRTYTTQRTNRAAAQVQSSQPAVSSRNTGRGKQVLAMQSDEEEESEGDEEVEEEVSSENEGGEDGSEDNSMEVVVGSTASISTVNTNNTYTSSTTHTEDHKPRRIKLVLTSSDPHTSTTSSAGSHSDSGDNSFTLHLKSTPSKHPVKQEEVSGVDLLASLAARSLDEEVGREVGEEEDYDEQEDEDVFTSEMLRLPGHKRIRRHSIAY